MNAINNKVIYLDKTEQLKIFFMQRKIPEDGWDVSNIENVLFTLSLMDTNNFQNKASVGEREGRCFSSFALRRNYNFTHGIGRSGDLTESQPKAPGSSILHKITNLLLEDFMGLVGHMDMKSLLVPLNFEITFIMCLLSFHTKRKDAKDVFYIGEDNLKINMLISSAGFNKLPFDLNTFEDALKLCSSLINCVIFDMEVSKNMEEIIGICNQYKIPTLMFNANFNVLDFEKHISDVDLVIFKENFSIIPVGAMVISSNDVQMLESFSKTYPGRATISFAVDVVMTFLHLGRRGVLKIMDTPQDCPNVKSSAIEAINLSHLLNFKDVSNGVISNIECLKDLIPRTYLEKGLDSLRSMDNIFKHVLQHGKIPDVGWDEKTIEYFLQKTSMLGNSRINESLECVKRRHFNFVSGIEFSKSSQSSENVLNNLTERLLQDLFKTMEMREQVKCLLLPVATGMTLVLAMLTFRRLKSKAKYVIWPRIDQKSCFKSIITAGLIPIIVDTEIINDQYSTDIDAMEAKIMEIGSENINCIMSTTSCFAPRACDDLEGISVLCKKYKLFHLVNNAYGLTSRYIMREIRRGKLKGNLDVFVQSTDKNICVPVGGGVIACFNEEVYETLKQVCSGKFSCSACLDCCVTLLSMGKDKFSKMVEDREEKYEYLKSKLEEVARRHGEEVIQTAGNPISIALTLRSVPKEKLTQVGSMLFLRNISGARVVTTDDVKTICGHKFSSWGSHSNTCKVPYIASAAAFGVTKGDIDIFAEKLNNVLLLIKNLRK